MLTLIVSRRIFSLVKNSTAHPKKMARYTQLRWSKIFAEKAADLLTVILHICGIQRSFETTMSVYKSQALDQHVNRNNSLTDDQWSPFISLAHCCSKFSSIPVSSRLR